MARFVDLEIIEMVNKSNIRWQEREGKEGGRRKYF